MGLFLNEVAKKLKRSCNSLGSYYLEYGSHRASPQNCIPKAPGVLSASRLNSGVLRESLQTFPHFLQVLRPDTFPAL